MKFVRLSIILVFCSVLTGAAIALDDSFHYTTSEKVGFSFYKLGKIMPDFDSWVKQNEKYAELKPRLRKMFLDQETLRLQQGYYNFILEEEVLDFKTKIRIKAMHKSELELTDERYLLVFFKANENRIYFPFVIGGDWIVLVPEKIVNFTRIDMNEETYINLKRRLFVGSPSLTINGILHTVAKPTSVDITTPLRVAGSDMWLMSAKILSLSIWDKKETVLLWEYAVEGYVPEVQRDLMDLYEEELYLEQQIPEKQYNDPIFAP